MELLELIQSHQQRHAKVQPPDVYKMLYQSVFGAEHILTDIERARDILRDEYNRVQPDGTAPLIENISTDGSICRVNLRPFKASGQSLDEYFNAFTESAKRTTGSIDELMELWEEFKCLVAKGELDFGEDSVAKFDAFVKESNPPVIHHSREYAAANHPAYRVFRRDVYEMAMR